MDRHGHLSIIVAACTRQRPKMVSALIRSIGNMAVPENATVDVLIVENDTGPKTESVIRGLAPLANGLTLDYVHEPDLGIPLARNRAAREALDRGAMLLAFIDDDEEVAPNWLVELVRRYRESDAVLIGGPVGLTPAPENLPALERAMHADITGHFAKLEARAEEDARTGTVAIATNNWLGETTLFSEHDIWFDVGLRFTGGSDSQFYRDVRAKGLPLTWAPKALVLATMPRERLCFGYQFRNMRDRTRTRFHMILTDRRFTRLRLLVSAPFKLLAAGLLTLALPFRGGRGILDVARNLGWVAGRASAAFGLRSTLYHRIEGE